MPAEDSILFYSDGLLASQHMRSFARDVTRSSPLIRRAAAGDRRSAEALHVGFWPFVREFERAIDRHVFPTRVLAKRFGTTAHDKLRTLARELREMRAEEGAHSQHWQRDAACLGLQNLDGPLAACVAELIEKSYDADHPRFFSLLAGTEYVAEELGAYLVASEAYTALFQRKRWIWGEIHIAAHGTRPSHREIDLDLARATAADPYDRAHIEALVEETVQLFGRAAQQIDAALAAAS